MDIEVEEVDTMATVSTRRVLTPAQLFGSYIDRYYSRLYTLNARNIIGNDQYAYFHSNRLAVIGVAPTHNMLKNKSKAVSISFNVNGKRDLLDNIISGKKKKGGFFIEGAAAFCNVTLEDGSVHTLSRFVLPSLTLIHTYITYWICII